MGQLTNIANALKKIKVNTIEAEGRVQVQIEKTSQFVSQVTKLYIDKDLLRENPDKVSFYVQNAVNEALRKEFQEMAQLSSSMMDMQKQPSGNNTVEKI